MIYNYLMILNKYYLKKFDKKYCVNLKDKDLIILYIGGIYKVK